MNIDLLVVIVVTVGLMAMGWYSKRYMRNATDFLAANRCAGRYMMSVAMGMAALSAAHLLATSQMTYTAGLGGGWWWTLGGLVNFIIVISGWFIYRFRETRVLTMAQFYEERYSRNFRIFAGCLGWVAGIIHWGVFPIVTAKLVVYILALPLSFTALGVTLPTDGVVMIALLLIAVYMAISGGQIAVMVTDFLQGSLTNVVFYIAAFFLIYKIGFTDIMDGLAMAPADASMINPFKMKMDSNFGVTFFLVVSCMAFYRFRMWPGDQGYKSAAISPHEAKMAGIIGSWRMTIVFFLIGLLTLACYAIMHHPAYTALAATLQSNLDTISDPHMRGLLRVPMLLRHILPPGLLGLMCAAFVGLAISTDDTNLHSWGSIFVQDIIMPFRKKPLSTKRHLLYLRLAVVLSSLSAIFFGFFFSLQDYLMMFMMITMSVYVGGAGAVMLGGLYWKRGNTAGAWAGMLTGSLLSVFGILIQNVVWPHLLPGWKIAYPGIAWLQNLPESCPVNGLMMSLYASLSAIVMYVVVSLLTRDPKLNMDKMLHRGKYTVEGEHDAKVFKPVTGLKALITWKGSEFSRGDKMIAMFTFWWIMFWVLVFLVITPIAMTVGIGDEFWRQFWIAQWYLVLVICSITIPWFLIGGFKDMSKMFRLLKSIKRDDLDDGRVVDGHNLADKSSDSE